MRAYDTIKTIYEHAAKAYPEECCGVVSAAGTVVPLNNVADDPYNHFRVSAQDYLRFAEGAMFMYHSHPDRPAVASEADRVVAERLRMPLMIISWPKGEVRMIGNPSAGKPLEGRKFIYGAYDCYSLIQDYYTREYQVDLPTITRPRFGWWEAGGEDPFTEGAALSVLVDVATPEHGDVILFASSSSKITDHIGIYLEGGYILHHRVCNLSARVEYDRLYRNATTRVLRRAD